MSSSISRGLADLLAPGLVDIDVAGGAGAGAAALGLDAGDQVLLGRLHHRHAGLGIDDLLGAVRLDEGDLGHDLARAAIVLTSGAPDSG